MELSGKSEQTQGNVSYLYPLRILIVVTNSSRSCFDIYRPTVDWIVTYRSFGATKHYLGCISCCKNVTIENHKILQILVVSYRNVRSQ